MREEQVRRLIAKLRNELGPLIVRALDDDDVTEIMLNPDGLIWTEGHRSGLKTIGKMDAAQAEALIGTVASSVSTTVTRSSPIVSGELPLNGERFEGMIAPVVASPTFTIRKRAVAVYSLDDYIRSGVISASVATALRVALRERQNILLCGGTASGKTTLANALIAELSVIAREQRIVIIEDTTEIQCAQENSVVMRTSDDVDMTRLLRSTLRMRPDRIIVGEVRGGEALTLLKAWNTGHPGGVATIHANNALAALPRLEQLIAEATTAPMGALIAGSIDLIVSITKTEYGRRVDELVAVDDFLGGQYRTRTIEQKEKPIYAA
ncbi:P-type conjugative transfer ATPase TrbB [uncultured Roseobacter sp.]|uniref:P-type conjugative transfer ATPase TrbB n=1 Tax=uncultured Roseobacter sp. TaxID=114847 RepID=UPI00260B9DE2|nr:P-type conjugative transfer ATPase TrbB [uncultured Roseobacter sp.]